MNANSKITLSLGQHCFRPVPYVAPHPDNSACTSTSMAKSAKLAGKLGSDEVP